MTKTKARIGGMKKRNKNAIISSIAIAILAINSIIFAHMGELEWVVICIILFVIGFTRFALSYCINWITDELKEA